MLVNSARKLLDLRGILALAVARNGKKPRQKRMISQLIRQTIIWGNAMAV